MMSLVISISLSAIWGLIFITVIRIIDKTLGTIELTLLYQSNYIACFLVSFIEVFIWFVFASPVLKTGDMYQIVGYILGATLGNYIGIVINNMTVDKNLSARIVVTKEDYGLVKILRNNGFGATAIKVRGINEIRYMIFINYNKINGDKLLNLVKDNAPNAFIIVNDTKKILTGHLRRASFLIK